MNFWMSVLLSLVSVYFVAGSPGAGSGWSPPRPHSGESTFVCIRTPGLPCATDKLRSSLTFSPLFFLHKCTCAYVWESYYVWPFLYGSVHVCVDDRGQPHASFLRGHPLWFLRQGLSVSWDLGDRPGWLASEPRDKPVFPF